MSPTVELEKSKILESNENELINNSKYRNKLVTILKTAQRENKDVLQRHSGEVELYETKIILKSEIYNWDQNTEAFERKVITKKHMPIYSE